MPQVDVQWPSEDEDFDAKVDNSPTAKTSVKSRPSISKVADKPEGAEDEAQPESDQEPETSDDHGEEAPAEPAEQDAEPEAPAADEPAHVDEPADQPDSDPAVQHEAATIADVVDEPLAPDTKLPTGGKSRNFRMPFTNNMPMLRLVAEGVLVVAVIGLGVWSWSLYSDRKDLQSQVATLNANPQSAVQKQTQQLLTRVGRLITLPTNETPTVAEVSDASQAKHQSSFFADAQNGDRVLMYVKSGEAILYRPSTDKIILVAPLVFTNSGSSASGTSSSTNKATAPATKGTTTTSTPSTSAKP